MPLLPKLPSTLAYGGDYNPEQWPESVWLEDVRLMREAGVNLVSLGIFSWSKLQPAEDRFDFTWLDRVMDLLAQNGIIVCLATATASPPPWMSAKYLDVLPVDASGLPLHQGSRQHYSPSSPTYRRHAGQLVRRIAERYRDHPALAVWHVNNEYACHTGECHGPASTAAFRVWLRKKYLTLDRLNAAWGTAFWSQIYGDWEEILTPRRAPHDRNPSQQLDFRRFMSDAYLELYQMEKEILHELTPGIPATTNLVWFVRAIDGRSWAPHMDFISWDCYPDPLTGHGAEQFAAVGHDLMRSLKKKPFLLIEQAPSAVTWRPVNPPKPPGVMRLGSLQALARGADGVMFFQWRASRAGAEKYITGMVGHGDPGQSRLFAEIKSLGRELRLLAPITGTTIRSRVAIVFDWPVCWALDLEAKPARIDYPGWAQELHRYFYERNIPVDFVHPGAELDGYQLVVAPALYLLTKADAANLEKFVERGGTLLATYFSGIVDENEQIVLGGYPGYLRALLGVRVEEWIPYGEKQVNPVRFTGSGKEYPAEHWAEVVHLEGAETVATYGRDFFANGPAITANRHGRGTAYYLSARLPAPGLNELLQLVTAQAGIASLLPAPPNVEVTLREEGRRRFLFILNHGDTTAVVSLGSYQGIDLLTGSKTDARLSLTALGAAVIQLS
ncbi:beta-galactosidase [Opitutus sp. GAS368]|uniref:beta-galactosidase n=1 Tax=Opitutus sp. GAS368 TaxID=1882749 RepID=UPI00087B8428|nr:beta-galactosidase [Opitutus sp. GAS368]SDS19129.1 beta-galactosidase [Opitutus sp. GAS368]